MTTPQSYLEVLSKDECLHLLPTVPVGWIAWPDGERVEMAPVNFVLHDGEVIARTSYGGKLAAAAHGVHMSLAADAFEVATHTGWSVVVSGRARVVAHADDLESLDVPDIETWVPGERPFFVGIAVSEVSGRRIATPETAARDLRG